MSRGTPLPSLEDLESWICAGALELDLPLPESRSLRALASHLRLLYMWNPRVNLTAIRDAREGVRRHTLEALEALPFLPTAGLLVDLGSGNGYPALPCLTLREGVQGVMIESVARKIDFLRAAIRESGLGSRVQASQTRLTGPESIPEGACVVTMRGFPAPAEWCPRAFGCESVRRVIAWLSRDDAGEIGESARASGLATTIAPLRAHPTGALLVLSRS